MIFLEVRYACSTYFNQIWSIRLPVGPPSYDNKYRILPKSLKPLPGKKFLRQNRRIPKRTFTGMCLFASSGKPGILYLNFSFLTAIYKPYACSSFSMLNFFICKKAWVIRPALAGSFISCPNMFGTICHERPNLSFNQPHCPSSPPSVSLAQK